MNIDYIVSMEKVLLSSILFNNDEYEKIIKFIDENDFYIPVHCKIFKIMKELNHEHLPIDEDFIIKKSTKEEIDRNIIIDILSSNAIVNTEAYAIEIKEASVKRKLIEYTYQIKRLISDENLKSTTIISELEENLRNLGKKSSQNFLKAVSLDTVEEEDTEYICKNFIPFPKHSLSIISAKGGMGKTFSALKICNEYIKEEYQKNNKVKTLIVATEDRVGKLKSRANQLNLEYTSQIDVSSIYSFDVLEKDFKTQNWRLTDDFHRFKNETAEYDLIIIDPMISFYSGRENDNGDAKAFMKPFVKIADERNQTIIFLHHADKEGKGSRGAGAFSDASRLTYFVFKDIDQAQTEKETIVTKSNKLRFEIIKQNDDMSTVKTLDYENCKVSNIGSFLVDVFPEKNKNKKHIEVVFEKGTNTNVDFSAIEFL